jgi:endonuclease/exonuclease/phosphatase family metal-dependent hydrolase
MIRGRSLYYRYRSRAKRWIGVPSASLWYDDHEQIKLSSEQLTSIARDKFTTHTSAFAEKLHNLSQFFLLPSRKSLQLIGSSFQSRPGANKNDSSIFRSRPFSILKGIAGFCSLVATIPLVIAALPAHLAALAAYKSRPKMSYIDNSKNAPPLSTKLSDEKPLHLRTHNVGFVLETMGITGDLRPVRERATELAQSILTDAKQPDIICFQECFHEDGTRILCDELKKKYPYIISNVLPTASGFNSGLMIASKYPVLETEFHCLQHNLGPERLSPKGMLRTRIKTPIGPIDVYNVHTQALLGKDRAAARYAQIQQIKAIMARDAKKPSACPQILVGDFNTSEVDAWGNDNTSDPNNPELKVINELDKEFTDIYLKDHDRRTGQRKSGTTPVFLDEDNNKMNLTLREPSGSWFHGLFPTSSNNFISRQIARHNARDRTRHDYTVKPVDEIKIGTPTWGTPDWRAMQTANTARFDYAFFPKGQRTLCGQAEIRRMYVPPGKQSASTDHLAMDILIQRVKRAISSQFRRATLRG